MRKNLKSETAVNLNLLPYLEKYGIREIIVESAYPSTSAISRLSSILSFVT
ncbi:MAG: hypothetical protein QG635_1635 [Bacteroidota bacterium]|nr:hypothetical protein [Bacteroidota bacterium]